MFKPTFWVGVVGVRGNFPMEVARMWCSVCFSELFVWSVKIHELIGRAQNVERSPASVVFGMDLFNSATCTCRVLSNILHPITVVNALEYGIIAVRSPPCERSSISVMTSGLVET